MLGGSQRRKTTTGPTKSTDHDSVVSVQVPTRGPYGAVLEDDGNGKAAVVHGWERVGESAGAIERHGGVRLGDVLVGVNDVTTVELPFSRVLELLRDENSLKKVLHFSSRAEYERRRGGKRVPVQDTERFASRVRRARVQEPSGGAASYAEYEIVCSLRMDATKIEHLTVRKWTVWRRFSDFEKLDQLVRKSLGWQLEGLAFPSKKSFLIVDKLAGDFLETRRQELDKWWQKVISVDRACDFHMHHCDPSLKRFLEADEHIYSDSNTTQAADGTESVVDYNKRRTLSVKGGRPPSLKLLLSKRRMAASNGKRTTTTCKNTINASETTKPTQLPASNKAPPPAKEEEQEETTTFAVSHTRADPTRAALFSQIAALKLDD